MRLDGIERLPGGPPPRPASDRSSDVKPSDIDREAAEERSPLLRASSAARQRGSPLRAASSTEPERSTASVQPCSAGSNGYSRQAVGRVSVESEHPLGPEEDARPTLGTQTPANGGAPEVAAVAGPPRLVGTGLLGRERLVLDEALAPPSGRRPDPFDVRSGQGRQALARPGLTAGPSQRLGAARARRAVLASSHGRSKVSAVRTQVTLRTAFTVCFAVVATAALVLFVFETRLALTLTVAATMLAIALDHVVRRMEARGNSPRLGHRPHHAGGGAAPDRADADRRAHGASTSSGSSSPRLPESWSTCASRRASESWNARFGIEERAQGRALGHLRPRADRGEPHPRRGHLGAERRRRLRDRAGADRVHAGVRRGTGARLLALARPMDRPRWEAVLAKSYRAVGGYLGGMLFICSINGTLTTTVLAMIGNAVLPSAGAPQRLLQPRALRRAHPHRRVHHPGDADHRRSGQGADHPRVLPALRAAGGERARSRSSSAGRCTSTRWSRCSRSCSSPSCWESRARWWRCPPSRWHRSSSASCSPPGALVFRPTAASAAGAKERSAGPAPVAGARRTAVGFRSRRSGLNRARRPRGSGGAARGARAPPAPRAPSRRCT